MRKIVLVSLVLFLPALLYIALVKLGKNQLSGPPFYGPKVLKDTTQFGRHRVDTIYHTIGHFKGVNLLTGQELDSDSLSSKLVIYHWMSLQDSNYLFRSNTMLKEWVQKRFEHYNDVKLVTLSSTPDKDSQEAIKALCERIQPNPNFWSFVYVTPEQASEFSKTLLLDLNKEEDRCKVLVVDREQHIRAIYSGNDVNAIKKLLPDDLRAIIAYYNLELKKNTKAPIR